MTQPAGYLVNKNDGLYGPRGAYYDYVLAANGLFIEAEGPLLAARVCVSPAEVRGLAPLEERLALRFGKIPGALFDLALSTLLIDGGKERYLPFFWKPAQMRYTFCIPDQKREPGHVEYVTQLAPDELIILDLHSHPTMGPFFSGTDDKDEQGLRLYGVVGHLNKRPRLRLRVGVYGYYKEIKFNEVFDGGLNGCDEGDEGIELPVEVG